MKISNLKKLLMLGLGAYSSVNNQVKAHSLQPNNLSVLDVTNVSGTDLINQPNINTQPSTMVYNNLSRINRIYDGNTRSTDLNGIFEERIADLMESEVTNQVSQILNYEDNHSLGEKQLVSLLANCNIALKKYNKHRDNKLFNTSLDNTVTALNNRQYYSYYLNNLKPNDTKSFLVAPVTSNNHLFSFVLYKKQDTKGNIFFQVVAVNKGALPFERGDNDQYHEMYESYKIPQQNIVELANMLGYDNGNIDPITGNWLTTGEVYKKIQDNTINKTWNTLDNIKARPQIVGNCYYKELEAGLKYAYSNAYDNWQIKKRMHGKTRLTPKWPVKTE